jgi:hypothetical protein
VLGGREAVGRRFADGCTHADFTKQKV